MRHGGVGRSHLANVFEDALHGLAGADDLAHSQLELCLVLEGCDPGVEALHLFNHLTLRAGLGELDSEFVAVIRFGEKIESP